MIPDVFKDQCRPTQCHVSPGDGTYFFVPVDPRNWTFEPNPDWDGRRMSPIASMDPDLERKIASRWKGYGIGSDYLDDDMRERLTLEQLRKRFPDV